jgi:excisionase family DNA binding protein
MTTVEIGSPFLTTSEAAEMLHVHCNTLRRWSDTGLLRSYRISSRGDRRLLRTDVIFLQHKLMNNNGYLYNRRQLTKEE